MMFSSQPRCFDVDALEAARRQRLHRAGLRAAPCSGEPGGVFVAIEMAVLVFVSALAMVSVIVTTGSPKRMESRAAAMQSRPIVRRRVRPTSPAPRCTSPIDPSLRAAPGNSADA